MTALQRVLDRVAQREKTQQIESDKFTVSEKIEMILQRLLHQEKISFDDLFQQAVSRVEVVVTFLALLELARLKQLRLQQGDAFGEIEVFRAL